MTYLNTQEGVADLFVKEVGECVAELLKGSSNKTSGMVRDDDSSAAIFTLTILAFFNSLQLP